MTETEWLLCQDPGPMLGFLRGKASERKLRLFAVACWRGIWPSIPHESRRAAEAVERFADGKATLKELAATGWSGYAAEATVLASEAATLTTRSVAYDAARDAGRSAGQNAFLTAYVTTEAAHRKSQAGLLREIFGNPFHPVTFDPVWKTPEVILLARSLYEGRRFEDMPVLADALEEAGCSDAVVLEHCRGPGPHARGSVQPAVVEYVLTGL
jgi:hypothetical protein